MKFRQLHGWAMSYKAAVALQQRLVRRVSLRNAVGRLRLVGGVDVSYSRGDDTMYAGVVVVDVRDWSLVERQGAVRKSRFPYIPGLLSFREAPSILGALRKLKTEPDCIITDGQGIAHPRGLGIGAHIGIIANIPTVGCAKSRLVGEHRAVGARRGSYASLKHGGRTIGRVLRTREGVKPVFVSPGHMVSIPRAARIVLDCCHGYRLPEPIRLAHAYVNEMRKKGGLKDDCHHYEA